MARWVYRRSRREQLLANNASDRYYALMSGLEPQAQNIIKPKRERKAAAPTASEHQEQAAVISWWALVHSKYSLPEFALFAVPNGGARDAITGSRLKAEGVRRGALDLILAKPIAPHSGLLLEMKVGHNKPTEDQLNFIRYLRSVGYLVSVHWDAGSAITAIENYLRDAI